MQLNLIMTIINRKQTEDTVKLFKRMETPVTLATMCQGTATSEHLSLYGLVPTEKALLTTVADPATTERLIRAVRRTLFIDIPGNGIMLSVPIKSIGGGRTMAYLTGNKTPAPETPAPQYSHELIYVVLDEGYSDMVMAAARPAGATGGTVISSRGTGIHHQAEKFLGISLASERDVLLIVVDTEKKTAVMKAIMEKAGLDSPAKAICFSVPVSSVAGLHSHDTDD